MQRRHESVLFALQQWEYWDEIQVGAEKEYAMPKEKPFVKPIELLMGRNQVRCGIFSQVMESPIFTEVTEYKPYVPLRTLDA